MKNIMIEQLFDAKKISTEEFKLYKLFSNELGSEVLKNLIEELFWEEPPEMTFTGVSFAFFDGRRSVIRAICATISKVQFEINKQLTPEENND